MPIPKRYPRERFTRALQSICQELDAESAKTLDYESPALEWRLSGKVAVKVEALWAFGSWAQGLPECGDLDLAVRVHMHWVGVPTDSEGEVAPLESALPSVGRLVKHFIRPRPLVHLIDERECREGGCFGTLPRADFLQVWSADASCDWRKVLAGLVANPDAQRQARPADEYPFRLPQTGMDIQQLERAVEARAQGLLTWEFVPHGVTRDEPADLTPRELQLALGLISRECRNPALAERAVQASRAVRQELGSKNVLHWFGKWGVWPTMHKDRKAKAIVITPSWKANAVNGSLIVRPGPNAGKV